MLLEDVGVPLPRLAELITGIEQIAEDRRLMISVIAHAGDGNTHPLIVHDPNDPDHVQRAEAPTARSWIWRCRWAAPSPGSTASGG